jgi:hypothetical protein
MPSRRPSRSPGREGSDDTLDGRQMQRHIATTEARFARLETMIESLSVKLDGTTKNTASAASAQEERRPDSTIHSYNLLPEEARLADLFKAKTGGDMWNWEMSNESGLFDINAKGWKRFVPSQGPLSALRPFWFSRDGRSMSAKAQAGMWPVLVEKLPEGKDLSKSSKPNAICTTIDGFAKAFMETAANAGPSADPPGSASVWVPPKEWHTEATLVLKAMQGLMSHPVLHETLEGKLPPATVRELFQRATEALRVDVTEGWLNASKKLCGLHLKSASLKDLLEYRKAFADVAATLQSTMGPEALREHFIAGCLKGPVPDSWIRLLLQTFTDVRTWSEVWDRLKEEAEKAQTMVDLYRHISQPRPQSSATTRVSPHVSSLQVHHMHLLEPQGTPDQVDFDGDLDELEDDAAEGDLRLALHHMGLNSSTPHLVLREACYICSQGGHTAAECPSKDKDEVTLPIQLAKQLNWAARRFLQQRDRRRATGQQPWNGKSA